MIVYYDSLQEGIWFKSLDARLSDAALRPFPGSGEGPQSITNCSPSTGQT